jgi:putative phosphoesterase
MRVALISDLHASEVALAAVLADIKRVGVDQIACLGDVATLGPRPRAVLSMLRDLNCPCVLGNHDEFLLDPDAIRAYTEAPIIVEAVDWCRSGLSGEELAFLRTFQARAELPLGGGDTLLLFHGTPRSNTEDLLATTPAEQVEGLFAGERARVMAGGHTHIQMLRQHGGALLVNPGSVGLPFKEYVAGRPPTLLAHAEYAIVEAEGGAIGVTLRRVPLEKAALRTAAAASDNPLRGMLIQQYS